MALAVAKLPHGTASSSVINQDTHSTNDSTQQSTYTRLWYFSHFVGATRIICDKRLRNGRVSFHSSVSSMDSGNDVRLVCCSWGAGGRYRSIAAGATYQLSSDIRRHRQSSIAGSVMLRAEDRGSTQTCFDFLQCFHLTSKSVFSFLRQLST